MPEKKILLGLTTTPGSDWREKIREIEKFEIKEIALFPTFLQAEERKELYNLLEKTKLESIPHVHLRGEDMPIKELDYFVDQYKTEVFNVHSPREFPINYEYSKYKKIIYLENTNFIPTEEEISTLGNGLCIDFAHWDNGYKMKWPGYEKFRELAEKFIKGCGHISAMTNNLVRWPNGWLTYDSHTFTKLEEFDYIKKYINYLPDIVSIELENSFKEQLEAKEYLEGVINN